MYVEYLQQECHVVSMWSHSYVVQAQTDKGHWLLLVNMFEPKWGLTSASKNKPHLRQDLTLDHS